jgi:ribosomal protein S18 acetylase RimI-like enzyme
MAYQIRKARPTDFPQLKNLLDGYYQGNWRGKIGQLERDFAEGVFEIFVAETKSKELVGFIVWAMTYDLNWCMKGGDIIDFYVSTEHRGRGAALLLTVEIAAEIQKRSGRFLKGGAANAVVRRFYERIAMCQPDGECYVSGRAFRHLAGLSGEKSAREIIKNLPKTEWNYQP